jgi:two-component system sensor histidine kinase/response regulator
MKMATAKGMPGVDVLIAEDSPTQAVQLCFLLEAQGHSVRVAANGRLALESARERKPALLITDVVMPEMDGYELCRAVKADDALRDVPVILVTSLTRVLDVARGLACGADNFIRKPYDPDAMIDRIDYLLRNRELRRSSHAQIGLEIFLGGERHLVTSGREQILDFLVSSYEEAVKAIAELQRRDHEVSRLNEELERRATALDAANEELESFSYSVSHDLRAPLRAIEGFSAILQQDHASQLDEGGHRLLGIVQENVRRMQQLIEDLLEFSHLGRQPISYAEVDMTAMAHRVFDELCDDPRRSDNARVPEFVVDALPPAWGDPALIRQVWVNLISNAIKYSGYRECPAIRISGHVSGSDNIYSVQDNGAGFDMKYVDHLFGVFQRLHSATEFPGTGVGLALSQRIIKRHGGRISAAAEVDKGATFEFALPGRGHEASLDVTDAM